MEKTIIQLLSSWTG